MGFLVFIATIALADALWWAIADARLRRLRHGRVIRLLVGGFVALMLAYIALFLFAPTLIRSSASPLPRWMHVIAYLWHVLFLGPALLVWAGLAMISGLRRLVSPRKPATPVRASQQTTVPALQPPETIEPASPPISSETAEPLLHSPARAPSPTNPPIDSRTTAPAAAEVPVPLRHSLPALGTAPPRTTFRPTRRQALAGAVYALPPLAAIALGIGTLDQLSHFRIRRFPNLLLPQLPRQLDGMTIAHVSDTHIGKFLHPRRLPELADAINRLDADFVVFTGDLIDLALDDLPHGISFLRSLRSRCGIAVCEGNHDLMENRGDFETQMRDAGLPLLVGDQMTLRFHRDGLERPVQFLGLPWEMADDLTAEAVKFLKPSLRGDAFPILLAHHPHSFDAAADAGMPLVLSGHTHGGQLMLTRDIGAGPIRFRYTSGHYRRNGSSLIVSNGLGNWFPVRVNAPAEIIHLTLRAMN